MVLMQCRKAMLRQSLQLVEVGDDISQAFGVQGTLRVL